MISGILWIAFLISWIITKHDMFLLASGLFCIASSIVFAGASRK